MATFLNIILYSWAVLSGIWYLPMALLLALSVGSLFGAFAVLVIYFGHLAILKRIINLIE